MNTTEPHARPGRLGLWDAVSFIVGVVVGAGIFETPPLLFSQTTGPGAALLVWAAAGVLVFIGALCYAELASTYPGQGGEYAFLSRAYGRPVGFLFGWAQLAVIFTGSLGMMAYVFADYAVKLFRLDPGAGVWLALGAVGGLTLVNALGIALGRRTQNILTAAKVLGLGAVLVAGLGWPAAPAEAAPPAPAAGGSIAFAMVLAFLTYGGWNDAVYLTADVRDRRRNMPLALLLGTGAVTLLYLAVNLAYLWGLGFDRARASGAIAADVVAGAWGDAGQQVVSVLVMVSALGAVNGLVLAGSRLYAAVGADHPVFARLGRWHPRLEVPLTALVVQAAVAGGMILLVGTPAGRRAFGSALVALGFGAPEWQGHGGFELLLKCTAPIFWLFFLLSAVSLFVLRWKDRAADRPFTVPLYPVTPLVFCATCGYMVYSGVAYAGSLGLLGGALLAVGVPVFLLSERRLSARGTGRIPAARAPG